MDRIINIFLLDMDLDFMEAGERRFALENQSFSINYNWIFHFSVFLADMALEHNHNPNPQAIR